jgi:plastocyanin
VPCEIRSRHPRPTRLALVVAVVLALTALAACSSSGGSSSSGDITVKDLQFKTSPVKVGATVTVKNNDDIEHTVTADDGKSFNITIDPGETATFTAPNSAGSYKFHCNIHPGMQGTLTVQ